MWLESGESAVMTPKEFLRAYGLASDCAEQAAATRPRVVDATRSARKREPRKRGRGQMNSSRSKARSFSIRGVVTRGRVERLYFDFAFDLLDWEPFDVVTCS